MTEKRGLGLFFFLCHSRIVFFNVTLGLFFFYVILGLFPSYVILGRGGAPDPRI